jgi:PAS domain S-box-containing protein
MKNNTNSTSISSSFKIVLLYAIVSVIYICTKNYLLSNLVNVEFHRSVEAYEGLEFILFTSLFLYFIVKKNINQIHHYYSHINDFKQKSDDEYLALFNHSPIPKWLFDIETLDFILVNDAACTTYGYSQEEFLSMNLIDIRPEDDIKIMEDVLLSSLDDGSYPKSIILDHRKKSGEIIKVKIEAKYVNYKGKKVKLAYAIDLTTELTIQKNLKVANSKLQLASEIAKLGYWTVDLSNSEIQWSEEVYKIFEVNPKTFELSVASIKNCFHPDEQLDFNPNYLAKFENDSIIENERRIVTSSGKIKWVLIRQYLIKDTDGKLTRLDGIFLDITKRKLHEKEILESNERFKIITKATIEAIMDWDIVNDTVIWGEGFNSIFGYDISVNNNNLWSNNIHPEDREKVLKDLNNTQNDPSKEYFSAEFRFLKANGTVCYVKHKGIFIRDKNGKAIRELAAMIDITETLEKLHKIETQNKILKEISWMQSHAVRAPLTNIMGLVSLLKDNMNLGIKDDKVMDYILDSAEKLDIIVKDIVKKSNDIDTL